MHRNSFQLGREVGGEKKQGQLEETTSQSLFLEGTEPKKAQISLVL